MGYLVKGIAASIAAVCVAYPANAEWREMETAHFRIISESDPADVEKFAARLESLVDTGIMERRPSAGQPGTPEYVVTDKGRDLVPAIVALTQWGDRWAAPDGPPIMYNHTACGEMVTSQLSCTSCGVIHDPAEVLGTRLEQASIGRETLYEPFAVVQTIHAEQQLPTQHARDEPPNLLVALRCRRLRGNDHQSRKVEK